MEVGEALHEFLRVSGAQGKWVNDATSWINARMSNKRKDELPTRSELSADSGNSSRGVAGAMDEEVASNMAHELMQKGVQLETASRQIQSLQEMNTALQNALQEAQAQAQAQTQSGSEEQWRAVITGLIWALSGGESRPDSFNVSDEVILSLLSCDSKKILSETKRLRKEHESSGNVNAIREVIEDLQKPNQKPKKIKDIHEAIKRVDDIYEFGGLRKTGGPLHGKPTLAKELLKALKGEVKSAKAGSLGALKDFVDDCLPESDSPGSDSGSSS